MPRDAILPTERQFSLAYLLAEIALIAVTLAAGRVALHHSIPFIEAKAVLSCIAFTAGCGALGGLCFRMAMGLVAGGIFSVSSIPLVWLLLSAASR
jgi:nitrate/nitrite transporter NarK